MSENPLSRFSSAGLCAVPDAKTLSDAKTPEGETLVFNLPS